MNMKKLAIAFSILVMLPVVAAAQQPLAAADMTAFLERSAKIMELV